jgi:hypothetical protein
MEQEARHELLDAIIVMNQIPGLLARLGKPAPPAGKTAQDWANA